MKTLAIVSTYNENCGNASYTHVLKRAFSEHVDVSVIPLDLFLLQKTGKFYRKHADKHIAAIARKLQEFDYVNIQFEAGLYGASIPDIFRRIKILINSSKNLILTMHRIDVPDLSDGELISRVFLLKMSPGEALRARRRRMFSVLYRDVVNHCQARLRDANIWIAVHTRRDRRIISELYGMQNVFDYPLTFLTEDERKSIQNSNARDDFRRRHAIPIDTKIVGAFGFISSYKGYETLIKALTVLPTNYHLYIFGGQHPQTIKPNLPLDHYLKTLIDLTKEMGDEMIKDKARRLRLLPKTLISKEMADDILGEKLMDRIRFIGGLSDPHFIEALRFSDFTVLPYIEVGQSMSGVVALAVESGANLFCTNNHSFNEVRKYYGDAFHLFDIGNHVELAQKLMHENRNFCEKRDEIYQRYNIKDNIKKHLELFGFPA